MKKLSIVCLIITLCIATQQAFGATNATVRFSNTELIKLGYDIDPNTTFYYIKNMISNPTLHIHKALTEFDKTAGNKSEILDIIGVHISK